MKRLTLTFLVGVLFTLLGHSLLAQTARVQIIHNSPEPLAASVDIYVNGTVAVPALNYRNATGFVELPINATVAVGIAGTPAPLPGTNVSLNLVANETYVIIANGVVDTSSINTTVANDNGVSTLFQLSLYAGHDTVAMAPNVSITAAHGAIDADSVDILANGGVLVDDVSYPAIGGPFVVPAAEYALQVTPYNDNDNIVLGATFVADLAGLNLGGEGIVVFASGYVDPAANNGGPDFGLFAVTRGGGPAVALPVAGTARAQVIHNAADVAAATVDIYVDLKTDTVKFEDVAFQSALPFTSLPADYGIEIVIALPTSTGIDDGVVATFPATLTDGESYYVIAQGILAANLGDYETMTNMGEVEFTLVVETGAREAADDATKFDLNVFHGSTDAPAVDVVVNQDFANAPITDLAYKSFTGYLPLDPAIYGLGVGASTVAAAEDVLATFEADLSSAAGGAGLLLATGFLTPASNQDGAALGLLLVLPDGTTSLLPLATSIRDLELNNELISLYPNPIQGVANLSYQVQAAGPVSVELLDVQGRSVLRRSVDQVPGEYQMSLDTKGLSQGIHILVVTTATTRSTSRVLVK
jgi:hypothetical protein